METDQGPAPELSEQDLEDLTKSFKYLDKNNDGSISADDLEIVLRHARQNPTKAEIKSLIESMDINGNNKIEFKEFIDKMQCRGMNSCEYEEEQLKAAFKVFDKDCNGFITAEELRDVMTKFGDTLTNDEVDAMMSEADMNGDGKVNYDEFSKILACSNTK